MIEFLLILWEKKIGISNFSYVVMRSEFHSILQKSHLYIVKGFHKPKIGGFAFPRILKYQLVFEFNNRLLHLKFFEKMISCRRTSQLKL